MSLRARLSTAAAIGIGALAALAPAAGADTPGHYIVADSGGTSTKIYDYAPSGTRTTITSGGELTFVEGLARLGADDYLIADKNTTGATANGEIIRVRSGTQTVLASANLLKDPHGIAISYDRKFVYTASRTGEVVETTIATGSQRLVAPAGGNLVDLRGIAVERDGSLLVVSTGATDRLVRIDPATGAQEPLLTGPPLIDPRAVMVRPDGDLVLGDQGGAGDGFILGVDLPAVTPSVISGGTFYANTSVPGALALDTQGRIIGADRNTGGGNTFGRLFAVSTAGTPSDIVPATTQQLIEPSGLAIVPPKCGGQFATIVGTPGKDTLPGTNGADVIAALGGKDTVKGKGGKDIICGGAGNDILNGGKGKDTIFPGKGKDKVNGGPGKDKLKCTPLDPRCG